jgi:hypothetical protein
MKRTNSGICSSGLRKNNAVPGSAYCYGLGLAGSGRSGDNPE